jgi:hypothetical protein
MNAQDKQRILRIKKWLVTRQHEGVSFNVEELLLSYEKYLQKCEEERQRA